MPKIILFSDIHIHNHKGSLKRLQDCLDVLDWVCKTAIERKINSVIFLGDLFQNRQKIQVLAYKKTYDIIKKYSDYLNLYLLIGNHDMWYDDKWSVSSVAPFDSIKGVNVIDKPSCYVIEELKIDFLPFTKNPIKIIQKMLARPNHGRILCGHVALDGAKWNKYMTAEVSVEHEGDMIKVDSNIFKGYEYVFLGHYHMSQQIGDVEYIGSPLQLNFGEAHEDKHIIELDTETLEKKYIKNGFSPKHYIVKEDELKNIDLNNSFVRIDVNDLSSISNAVELKNEILNEQKALSVEFCQSKKKENGLKEEIDTTKDIFSNNQVEILEKYTDSTDYGSLERDTLIDIGKQLFEETKK